jgi:heterodisulfide reductase subunit A
MMDAGRHPNIKLLTNSELVGLEGKAGDFKAQVRRHPRYVSEELCTGCGVCSRNCPVEVLSEFDAGVGRRKAIFIPFPQAVPNIYILDRENCSECGICVEKCPRGAVNLDDRGEDLELRVGSVVVATGFEVFDPTVVKAYGFGLYDNVITSMQMERFLNASGPTQGHILRPSDGKVPKKIGFVQCVGTRGEAGLQYCSRFCCMNSIKDCMLVKQHAPEIEELKIFYIDIRAAGKGFEEFYQRSLEMPELCYIRGRPSKILEDSETKDLIVQVEDGEAGKINDFQLDMVVLSSGAIANRSNKRLSEILSIEQDESGFFKAGVENGSPLESTKEGIYLCGCASGINDISDSVAQGSGAAAEAGKHVFKARLEERKEEILELDVSGPPRIGVFVCHCGINIAGVLDIDALKKYAETLPDVVFVRDSLFLCSDDGQRRLQEMIKKKKLNRVVAAACTPRTHEPIFRESCARIGLNPYLFEMVNVRDQCSWVHTEKPQEATEKAKDLIRMGVAKARLLEPLYKQSIKIDRKVLVIGGGISGMRAALDLEAQGFQVTLIEKEKKLGGALNSLHRIYPQDLSASDLLGAMVEKIKNSKVEVLIDTETTDIKGFIGNFEVFTSKGELKVGTIVLAIGGEIYQPEGEFGYGKFKNVITNLELERMIKDNQGDIIIDGERPKTVAFIQCVGSRDLEKNPACSRFCCPTTIKQAIELKKRGTNVMVFHRDMRTVGTKAEEHYRTAREMGVRFLKYTPEIKPQVVGQERVSGLEMLEPALNRNLRLPVDAVVLACGMISNEIETGRLQGILKVPRGADGFFMERHAKLGPVETTVEGVFVCGTASGPKDISDSIAQGSAAAAKVTTFICRDTIELEPTTCIVDADMCRGCGKCVRVCEFLAPKLVEKSPGIFVAEINQALCKGCGTCASWCPTGAITAKHFTDRQVESMIETFLAEAV